MKIPRTVSSIAEPESTPDRRVIVCQLREVGGAVDDHLQDMTEAQAGKFKVTVSAKDGDGLVVVVVEREQPDPEPEQPAETQG